MQRKLNDNLDHSKDHKINTAPITYMCGDIEVTEDPECTFAGYYDGVKERVYSAIGWVKPKERPRVYGDEIELANLRQRNYPCGCHWIKHFGFIPHMDCEKHKDIAQTYERPGSI